MITRFFLIILIFISFACSKKENLEYEKSQRIDPFVVYQEGLAAFEKKDYYGTGIYCPKHNAFKS